MHIHSWSWDGNTCQSWLHSITLHFRKKRHFRLLRNFACWSNVLWVAIYTFRNDLSLLKICGFYTSYICRDVWMFVFCLFVISVYPYLLQLWNIFLLFWFCACCFPSDTCYILNLSQQGFLPEISSAILGMECKPKILIFFGKLRVISFHYLCQTCFILLSISLHRLKAPFSYAE